MFSRMERYIVRQAIPWILVALLGAMLLFLSTQLIRVAPLLAGHGAGFAKTALAILLLVLPLMGWALTPAFSIAVFAVGGRMAEEGELVAMDASGLSRTRAAAGPVMLALLVTGISAWIWLDAAPWSGRILRRIAFDMVERSMVAQIKPGTFYHAIPGLTFFADTRASDGTFGGVLIETTDQHGQTTEVVAKSARFSRLTSRTGFTLRLRHGTAFMETGVALSFQNFEIRLPHAVEMEKRLDFLPRTLTAPTARLLGPPPKDVPRPQWQYALWRRIGGPIGGLALALLSIHLAFTTRWRSRGVAVGLAVAIFLAFHLLGRFGETLMTSGALAAHTAALLPAAAVSACFLVLLIWPRHLRIPAHRQPTK